MKIFPYTILRIVCIVYKVVELVATIFYVHSGLTVKEYIVYFLMRDDGLRGRNYRTGVTTVADWKLCLSRKQFNLNWVAKHEINLTLSVVLASEAE